MQPPNHTQTLFCLIVTRPHFFPFFATMCTHQASSRDIQLCEELLAQLHQPVTPYYCMLHTFVCSICRTIHCTLYRFSHITCDIYCVIIPSGNRPTYNRLVYEYAPYDIVYVYIFSESSQIGPNALLQSRHCQGQWRNRCCNCTIFRAFIVKINVSGQWRLERACRRIETKVSTLLRDPEGKP